MTERINPNLASLVVFCEKEESDYVLAERWHKFAQNSVGDIC